MDFTILPDLLDLQDRTHAFIHDSPSEVHRWSLAQEIVKHGANR